MYIHDVIYDGSSFADAGFVLTNINHLTLAKRDNQVEKIANRNGAVLVQSLLGIKPIYIEGYYIGTSSNDAQYKYDYLAQILNRQERPLIVYHNGGERQYIATPENIAIQQPDGLNRLVFSCEFIVPSGYSANKTTTTAISQSITTASASIPFTVEGSVTARPLINLTFSGVTGGTSKTVSVRNARDFVGLTFARTFVNGDYITIDSDNFQLYINGVLTPPVGRFPSFAPGSAALAYSDTLTTRSVLTTLTYVRKDL